MGIFCLYVQIVFTLETYGVKNIVGIPFGYRGFFEKGLKEMPVRMLFHHLSCASVLKGVSVHGFVE
jgi:hypothetical protein